jgi:hypothetical protein
MYLQTETSQTQPQTPNISIPPESAIIYGTPVVMFSLLLAAVVTIVCRFQDYKGKVKIKLWHENMGFDIALDSQENKDPNPPNPKPLDASQSQNSVEVLPEPPK